MKVIPASFEIQDDLDRSSLAVRIEACGRICYKSEDKITEESAGPFIRRILQHGHNSVAEMAVITLKITIDSETLAAQFYQCIPRFVRVDRLGRKELLMTASVRAYRELYKEHGSIKMVKAIGGFLAEHHPLFFEDIAAKRPRFPLSGIVIEKLSLAEVDDLPVDLLINHRYLGVKFITNRAVTHEIVRHRPCAFLQESQRYCRYSEDKFDNQVTFIKPMFFEEGSPEYEMWQRAMEETEKIYLELLKTSSPQAARTVLPNSCKTEIIVYCNLLEWAHIFRLRTTPQAEPSMREVMVPLLKELDKRYPSVFDGITVTV
ncbi:MAG: FAD-dependent thymidylate synthase [Proteobacteria bacterium]|nr:FAD-dependent thymidylate synthase [Pseudomonadota bacterium]MBU1686601.1 FAD-dependent thymidylate synthase [Pseudomonadota bacterium]